MTERHFKNVFSDNHENEGVLNVSNNFWKDKINNLVECISKNASTSSKNTLYTGTSGIAYMFYHLATSDLFKYDSKTFLNEGLEVLKLKSNSVNKNGFICGDAGINAVNAAIHHQIGDEKMAEKYLENFQKGIAVCKSVDSLKPDEDELFVGRAGYLYGVLWLEKVFGKKIIPNQDVYEICSMIIMSGREYSKKNKSIFPLMYSYHKKEYLGAAHGLCTILQILISFPQFTRKHSQTMLDIKKCIDILISFQTDSGNFPTKIIKSESKQRAEKDELVHWCHGAPGIVYLLAKAYLVFQEPSYLECCLKCGDLVWTKGLLKKGPGICHGISGNGYVFLLLYRLTGDVKHLNRALKFGEFMFTDDCIQGSRKPDNLYSLYEGLAGTVCYLTDLTQPEKACFPFLDVF